MGSIYYNYLNDMLKGIIEVNILGNPNIKKLLYYYPDTVDFSYSPFVDENGVEREDVDGSLLYMTHVMPYPKSPDIITEQKCYLYCNLAGGDYISGGKFQNINIVFDIVCHLDAWIIKEGFRVYSIASEIDKVFNYQSPNMANYIQGEDYYKYLDIPSINKLSSSPFRPLDYSKKYYGMQLVYTAQINSNMGCGD